MSILKRVRPGRLVALGIPVLVVLLVLAWGHGGAGQVGADEPHAGLDFSIAVDGVAGCDTTGGDTKCLVPLGTTFTVSVSLDSLPADIAGYSGYDASLTYSGVTSKDNASFDGEDDWPDCVYGAALYRDGTVLFGCAIGLPPAGPSTYTGRLGAIDFNCTEDETEGNTVTLVHGFDTPPDVSGNTSLMDGAGAGHAEAGTETLTINCLVPPTPTVTATPTATTEVAAATATPTSVILPPTGVGSDADGGAGAGLWIVIGTLLAAAATGLAVIGWRRYARSS